MENEQPTSHLGFRRGSRRRQMKIQIENEYRVWKEYELFERLIYGGIKD